jgi:hypothetical protein
VKDQVPLSEMTRHLVRMRLASSPACEVTSIQKSCGQNLDAPPQRAAWSKILLFCRWLTKRNEVVTDRLRKGGSPTNRLVVSPPYITMASLSSAHIDPHPLVFSGTKLMSQLLIMQSATRGMDVMSDSTKETLV